MFFVQRAFHVFDKDGDGTISLAEFLDTMSEFSKQGHMEKIMFLFKIYDIDGETAAVEIHNESFSLNITMFQAMVLSSSTNWRT